MAISTFNFQLELTHDYQVVYRGKVVMGRSAPEESDLHILLKFLGWCLFHHEYLAVEKQDVDPDYRPDLVVQRPDGSVRAWIEAGNTSARKIDKVTRRFSDAKVYVLHQNARAIHSVAEQIRRHVERNQKVGLVYFEDGFCDRFLRLMTDKNDVVCNIMENDGLLELTMNGDWAQTKIIRRKVIETD